MSEKFKSLALTSTQITYLHARISGILFRAKKKLAKKFTTPEKKLSDRDRYKLVKSGAVLIRTDISTIRSHDDIKDLFDFSKHEKDSEFDQEGFDKVYDDLTAKANCIRDVIFLGRAEEAVKMIQELEKCCEG